MSAVAQSSTESGFEPARLLRNISRIRRHMDSSTQCLAEAIPVSGQCHALAFCMELADGESVYQHSLQNQRRGSMGSTTALSWPNRPCAMALHTLPSPWTKMPNRSATTRGFRML
jgi:hypothetical protein